MTRGDLAALIGTRFPNLLRDAAGGRTVIITDTRNYWGHQWILDVTQAGVMEVDAGYRFEPGQTVRRGELAEVVDAMKRSGSTTCTNTSHGFATGPQFWV